MTGTTVIYQEGSCNEPRPALVLRALEHFGQVDLIVFGDPTKDPTGVIAYRPGVAYDAAGKIGTWREFDEVAADGALSTVLFGDVSPEEAPDKLQDPPAPAPETVPPSPESDVPGAPTEGDSPAPAR